MILTGLEIEKEVLNNKIKISPFNSKQITTNSYDVRLGNKLIKFKSKIIDPKKKVEYEEITIPKEGLILKQHEFCLGCTDEMIGSDYYVPLLHAKSGTARRGLFVHVTSDLIDIGSYGNLTLQLFPTIPIKIYPNMLIAQVTFWQTKGNIVLYNGKYQGSKGPRVSEIYKDFE